MTISRRITAATAVLAVAGSGVAAAADAPVVGAQHSSSARTAPQTIPGTGVKKGAKLPSGARIIYRDVTLEAKQKVKLTLTAAAGKRIRGLVPQEGSNVGFVVTDRGSYVGRKKVTVRAYTNPKASGELTGRIYGLVR
jgi:hypothetical protein